MEWPRWFRRRALGLRLRLSLIYIGVFAVLLAALGFLFRETLQFILHKDASALLEEEWAAVKGYLRVEKGVVRWYYDKDDPDEALYVQRLRSVFLLAARDGRILEVSPAYSALGADKPQEIERLIRQQRPEELVVRDEEGYTYLIRKGLHIDDGRREFFLAIGRSLDQDARVVQQFTRYYFFLLPVLILGMGFVGWYMAGRALRPLNDVARGAQLLTGQNLSLRIPRRGAGDELDHLIDRFNDMVDRLESSFNQVRQFSIDVSHEIRTPLTAIRGQLDVALMTAQTAGQFREAVMAAIEDVDQVAHVVRTLLHLSQAETGQITLAREPVDLAALAAGVLEQFQIPAEASGQTLESTIEPAVVQGDRVQLERLLSNLLSNAVKYTPTGGRIAVTVRRAAGSTELQVADTGRGISTEHLPHIFDRFYRVPDGAASPDRGLGLGLSFVAWIAKAHNAKVQVESEPGLGSTFTVSFPAEPAAAPRPEPVVPLAAHNP